MEISLNNLPVGDTGRITGVVGGREFRKKLALRGVKEGSIIRVMKSALSGGPVVIEINRNSMVVGRGMAQRVMIKRM